MKTVEFVINYGGFLGCDDTYSIEVSDDATQDEIDDAISDKFEDLIHEYCSWELVEDPDED